MTTSSAALVPAKDHHERLRGIVIGFVTSMGINLLVIVVLVSVSRLHRLPVPPTEPLTRFAHVETPPPPEPEQQPQQAEPSAAPPEAATPPPLPSLDVPTVGDAGLALPSLGDDRSLLDLPLAVPAFVAASEPVAPVALPATDAGAVDVPASATAPFDLERFYPRQARDRGIEGESVVTLAIDADGLVTSWTLVRSTPPGVFDQALDRLVHSMRYKPALRSGKPVASTFTQRILWSLSK